MSWELFEHTADLGLRVRAPTLEALFEEAAEGLFAMIASPASADFGEPVRLRVEGARHDWLLRDWLDELLYLFETRRLLLGGFKVALDATGLTGTARGQPFDPALQRARHEVKAITYHRLRVERSGDLWVAEVIVDI
jgi:SHS2 domain-containing protein